MPAPIAPGSGACAEAALGFGPLPLGARTQKTPEPVGSGVLYVLRQDRAVTVGFEPHTRPPRGCRRAPLPRISGALGSRSVTRNAPIVDACGVFVGTMNGWQNKDGPLAEAVRPGCLESTRWSSPNVIRLHTPRKMRTHRARRSLNECRLPNRARHSNV